MFSAVTELEKQLTSRVEALEAQNRLLQQKLEALIRLHFGKKSEKLDSAQLELLLQAEDGAKKPEESTGDPIVPVDEDSSKPSVKKALRERKPRLPEDLPIEEHTLIPDVVKACPEAWRRIGEEVSEQLDYRPGRFLKQRLIRPKYVKRSWREQDQPPVIASLPPRVIEGGLPTAGLLAHIAISKYCDHLPLYRQEQIFRQRHHLTLPRQTMARWIEQTALTLQPIARIIHQELLQSTYLQVDETPIKHLAPGNGQSAQGYLWVVKVPGPNGGTSYHWHKGRSHHCLHKIIPTDFSGTLQSDGYRAYQTFIGKHPKPIQTVACWAHVRRKIHDALLAKDSPTRSSWLLRQIAHLYRIERHLRETRAGPALRQATRASQSRPIIQRLHSTLNLFKTNRRHLPQSLLGKAISYALGQWSGLHVYLENGIVEIDNNLVENAVRPTKLGAKNWLFIGSEEAGWRSAVIYTIIENCRHHGLEPQAYLKDLLEKLPSLKSHEIKDLTPKRISELKRIGASRRSAS